MLLLSNRPENAIEFLVVYALMKYTRNQFFKK